MNKQIKKLAKRAGFVFWSNEAHGPGPGHIDWSCDYDKEFDKFCDLLIQRIARIASERAYGAFEAEETILKYFDVKQKEPRAALLTKKDDYDNNHQTTE